MAIKWEHTRRRSASLAALGLAGLGGLGQLACNDRPVDTLDSVVTSVSRQENALPAKTKLDFLFIVDNSASMCEEQTNLTKNFRAFTEFLFDDLNASADYRLAVVSTDLANVNERGTFLYKPAPPVRPANCELAEPYDTADCPAGASPIIRADDIGANCAADDKDCFKADLERQFRCRATLGTSGDSFEKGLEATRLALSCGGPNGRLFAQCCEGGVYNPACNIPEGAEEPAFLRPDAVLAVVIISDEDDCSDPAENPAASNRGVCRPGGAADSNGDGLPDVYSDLKVCADSNAELPSCVVQCANGGAACDQCRRAATEINCFKRDCGLPPCGPNQNPAGGTCTTAADCSTRRCEIDANQNSNCEWYRSNLTPVADYYNFLVGLKARPREQLLVATIVGKRAYTENGDLITYNQPTRPEHLICLDDRQNYDPGKQCDVAGDCPGAANSCDRDSDGSSYCSGEGAEATCCPGGACVGNILTSCESENGAAFAGRRYLELSELFDRGFSAGVGCPPGSENDPATCVSICVDDFAGPLGAIKDKVARLIGTYCLDKPPACQVATDDGPRACETAEEMENTANYQVRLRMQCLRTEDQGGKCQDVVPPRSLASNEWTLFLGDDACSGGARVELTEPPPAGADVYVEYPVSITGAAGRPQPDAQLSEAADSGAL